MQQFCQQSCFAAKSRISQLWLPDDYVSPSITLSSACEAAVQQGRPSWTIVQVLPGPSVSLAPLTLWSSHCRAGAAFARESMCASQLGDTCSRRVLSSIAGGWVLGSGLSVGPRPFHRLGTKLSAIQLPLTVWIRYRTSIVSKAARLGAAFHSMAQREWALRQPFQKQWIFQAASSDPLLARISPRIGQLWQTPSLGSMPMDIFGTWKAANCGFSPLQPVAGAIEHM